MVVTGGRVVRGDKELGGKKEAISPASSRL